MDLVLLQPGNPELLARSAEPDSELKTALLDSNLTLADHRVIELVSWHGGMQQCEPRSVSNGARRSGRPTLKDITCVRYLDALSPSLYHHCLSATPLDAGTEDSITKLLMLRAGVESPILTIELRDTLITSIEQQSHPNDLATEQLVLSFSAIRWRAGGSDEGSTPEAWRTASWNVATNRPTFD